MLFKRRDKAELGERVRAWAWPKRGWRRAWGYVWHRVTRLSDTPHAIALGFASGAFASFTPFIGFHFMVGFLAAYLTRSNLIASALGTFVGNPLTFPFIWFSTYTLGSFVLGIELEQSASAVLPAIDWMMLWSDWGQFWQSFWNKIWPMFKPMLLAGVPMGVIAGTICYFPVKIAVITYQARRRERLKIKPTGRAPIGQTPTGRASADRAGGHAPGFKD